MTPDALLREEAAKWLREAGKDLNAAAVLRDPEPSRSVFHSQQAAEKAIKAFLSYHQITFRRTHDLAELGEQAAVVDLSLEPLLREIADLTDYASAFRYPDAPYEPDSREAEEAFQNAARLCGEIRRRIGSPA